MSAAIDGLLIVCVCPVAGWPKLADHVFDPPGTTAESVSPSRLPIVSAASFITSRRVVEAKKPLVSRL